MIQCVRPLISDNYASVDLMRVGSKCINFESYKVLDNPSMSTMQVKENIDQLIELAKGKTALRYQSKPLLNPSDCLHSYFEGVGTTEDFTKLLDQVHSLRQHNWKKIPFGTSDINLISILTA